jgi:hypothetical protein
MSSTAGLAPSSGEPLFAEAKPTGNLYRPNIEAFLGYSRLLYQNRRYTDGDLPWRYRDDEKSSLLPSATAERTI